MSELLIDDIYAAENGVKRVKVILQGIGRALHQMREGKELGPEYGFEGYSRENFCGSNYSGQDGPDWGVGTPILSLRYCWPRAENVIYVTLPLGWIEQDWRELETDRLSKECAARDAAKSEELRLAAERRAEAERKTFERLKAKFEPLSTPPAPLKGE